MGARTLGAVLRQLAAMPFFVGMTRAVDMFGYTYEPMAHERYRGTGADPDAAAILEDWVAVGEDFIPVAEEIDEEVGASHE